jgi:hypothetical protein
MENTNTAQNLGTALLAFVLDSQRKINEKYKTNYPNLTVPCLVTAPGKKFVKIVCKNHPDDRSGSAWAFIELSTGNILKAASWAAPAKHARGNVYQPETWASVTSYGPAYLR